MFVPSESVFAEIHEHYDTIVQRAFRSRVVIVSPSLLMLSIQVIQSILKDQRMREQAHLIQGEVVRLMDDVTRLDERVRKLQVHSVRHEGYRRHPRLVRQDHQAGAEDRSARDVIADEPPAAPEPPARSADSRTGNLRLRVVDEE